MTYESAVLALTPKVFLKLDETTGTTAADSSGNGYTATHVGSYTLGQPSLMVDGSGNSVKYNGSGYTTITPVSTLNANYISLNMRIAATAANGAGTGTQVLAARWSGSNGYLWLLTLENGVPRFTFRPNGFDNVAAASAALTPGQNYTIGVTYDGSNGRLFVNGSAVGTAAISGTMGQTQTEFEIARAAAAVYGNVQVDGFAYWTSALTPAQMATLHNEATATPGGGNLSARLPVPTMAATGTVQVSGSLAAALPVASASITGELSDPRRVGFGLALASMTPTSVIPPTSGDAPVPVHITTPTVPAPVLVDGRPS